jgi:hypothetical protein
MTLLLIYKTCTARREQYPSHSATEESVPELAVIDS